jgi:hypothetical protein
MLARLAYILTLMFIFVALSLNSLTLAIYFVSTFSSNAIIRLLHGFTGAFVDLKATFSFFLPSFSCLFKGSL